jgi:hypothetical protein
MVASGTARGSSARALPLVYPVRVRSRVLGLAVLITAASCGPSGNTLVVQVVSDLAPLVEFDEVRVEAPTGAVPVVVAARPGSGYGRGVRVLSIDTAATTVSVRVSLLLRGEEVVSASRTRRISGPTSILTIRAARDCIGVVCGDALASSCLGGACVRDDCTPETPENCPPGECGPTGGGATCMSSAASCVDTTCAAEGICVDDPRDERCGPGEVCNAAVGCVATAVADAGPGDAAANDAGLDGGPVSSPTPIPRVVSTAYWTNWFGPVFETPGMSMMGYEIPSAGVADGELLLLIGCIDNGTSAVWPDPLAPGFTQLTQDFWGHDGQTCVVDWKIADAEPAIYAGTYGPGIVSASAVLALIAVSGVDPIAPISASQVAVATGSDVDVNPVTSTSLGVTTTAPNTLLLYAANADWNCYNVSTVSFTVPTGYRTLLQLSDHGNADKDWTAIQIEAGEQAVPGPTGPVSSTMTSTTECGATPWNVVLAIRP